MSSLRSLLLVALTTPSYAPSLPRTPQLNNDYVNVLTWWCETMDHTADGPCDLLWTHRHMTHTGDLHQLDTLNTQMRKAAPAGGLPGKERMFGGMVQKYCGEVRAHA